MNVIETLLNGFLSDRNEKFVLVNNLGQQIMNQGERPDGAYSDLIINTKKLSPYFVQQQANRVARMFLNVMGLSRVPISYSRNSDYTNGKSITLSTAIFDHTQYSIGQRMDTFIGHTLHEGAHILYSDFSLLFQVKNACHKDILNIVEDERIERLIGRQFPGYTYFVEALKLYNFSKAQTNYDKQSEGDRLLSLFFYLVRFPSKLEQEWVANHIDILIEIKNVLTPYPSSAKDAFTASVQIYELLEPYLDEQQKENGLKPAIGISVSDSPNEAGADVAQSDFVNQNPIDVLSIQDFADLIPDTETVFVKQIAETPDAYNEIRKTIKRHIATLRSLLSDDFHPCSQTLKGLQSGEIDTSMLADSKAGNRHIYQERILATKVSKPIVLAIDESGSMAGDKIETAKQLAVLFKEALSEVADLQCYIYGHTSDELYDQYGQPSCNSYDDNESDGLTWLGVYQEPGYVHYKSIASINAKSCNRDGFAIRAITNRVRKFTKDKGILFVLSDGNPTYRDGIVDTRNAVIEAQRAGLHTIQIAIGDSDDSGKMFDHFVRFESVDNLIAKLSPLIRKQISTLKN